MRPGTISSLIVVVAASLALGGSAANAQESDRLDPPSQQEEWSEDAEATSQENEGAVPDSSDTSDSLDGEAEANKSFPLSLSIEYTLVSDYTIDGGYLGPVTRTDDHDTRIAGMTYGVNLTYDLSTALQMPPEAGSMSVAGFINYFDPTSNLRRTIGLEDELWGGMTLAWSW